MTGRLRYAHATTPVAHVDNEKTRKLMYAQSGLAPREEAGGWIGRTVASEASRAVESGDDEAGKGAGRPNSTRSQTAPQCVELDTEFAGVEAFRVTLSRSVHTLKGH
jgi:hypothetical protein